MASERLFPVFFKNPPSPMSALETLYTGPSSKWFLKHIFIYSEISTQFSKHFCLFSLIKEEGSHLRISGFGGPSTLSVPSKCHLRTRFYIFKQQSGEKAKITAFEWRKRWFNQKSALFSLSFGFQADKNESLRGALPFYLGIVQRKVRESQVLSRRRI